MSHIVRTFWNMVYLGYTGKQRTSQTNNRIWECIAGCECVNSSVHSISYLLNGWLLPSMWRWCGRANRAEKLNVDDLGAGRSMWAPLKFSSIVIERLPDPPFIQNISGPSDNTNGRRKRLNESVLWWLLPHNSLMHL